MRARDLAITGALALALAACGPSEESAAQKESRQTQILTDSAAVKVGMPAIKNFTEKRLAKMLYELRDQADLVTYTYVRDMHGKRHSICPSTSVGFGLPYATQYTASTAMQRWYIPGSNGYASAWGSHDLPQPEPNGLHMPSSAEGTWVICLGHDGKTLKPAYIEERAEVYLEEMPHVD